MKISTKRRAVWSALTFAAVLAATLFTGAHDAGARQQFKPNLVIEQTDLAPAISGGGAHQRSLIVTIRNTSDMVGAGPSQLRFVDAETGNSFVAGVPSIGRESAATITIPVPNCTGTGIATIDISHAVDESIELDNAIVVTTDC